MPPRRRREGTRTCGWFRARRSTLRAAEHRTPARGGSGSVNSMSGRESSECKASLRSRPRLTERLARIWRYRELLVGLVRKELKVKYKNSVLGFLWSLLNPLLYLVVFYVVFQVHPDGGDPDFAIFLLSGLLVWNLFSTGVGGAHRFDRRQRRAREEGVVPARDPAARLDRRGARALLPAGDRAARRARRVPVRARRGRTCRCSSPALVALLLLAAGARASCSSASTCTSATPQHLLELVLLAWFWMTPIVYPFMLIGEPRRVWRHRSCSCSTRSSRSSSRSSGRSTTRLDVDGQRRRSTRDPARLDAGRLRASYLGSSLACRRGAVLLAARRASAGSRTTSPRSSRDGARAIEIDDVSQALPPVPRAATAR